MSNQPEDDASNSSSLYTDAEHIHVVPVNDLKEHLASVKCWCNPQPDIEEPEVWVHNSLDRRELYEREFH